MLKPSLVVRIAIGKSVGFLLGLTGFVFIPALWPDADPMLCWAMLLWYTTFGALIGLFGVFDYHPILKLPMPWWFRAPFLGAWLNFVLTLFIYDDFKAMMMSLTQSEGILSSPFWFVLEGALVGLFIGYLATKFGGEGPATVARETT
jgi:signal transduction histidine kinase